MSEYDVAVIGAGAAGLAAARTLVDLGRRVIILEARDRIGGRAWTENTSFGVPIDLGCGWLHSADVNPWREQARRLGFTVVEENPKWRNSTRDHWIGAGKGPQWDEAIDRSFEAISAAGSEGRDVAASTVIPDGEFRALFDAIITWACGVETRELSTLDFYNYRNTGFDWPVLEGYGALVARYGEGLPVRLNMPVRRVSWAGPSPSVETAAGSIAARAVIVTVPLSVLQTEGIRFDPPLPAAKQEAIAGIKVGVANKVFIEVEGDPFGMPDTSYATSSADRRRVASLAFRPFGYNLAGGYLGGDLAHELDLAGERATVDFVIGEFVSVFGADVRRHLGKAVASRWFSDPWSRGAYSAAKPGKVESRKLLAQPIDNRIFFAGEACSIEDFGTCHGAYLTGIAAAEAAAGALLSR